MNTYALSIWLVLSVAAIAATAGYRYRSARERAAETLSAFLLTAGALALAASGGPGDRPTVALLLAGALAGHETLRRSWTVTERLRGTVRRCGVTGIALSVPDGRLLPLPLYYDEVTGFWPRPNDSVTVVVKFSWLFGSILDSRPER
jgi:hypothetical protein